MNAAAPAGRVDAGPTTARLLHLGCGRRWHADWLQADLHPASEWVHRVDVAAGPLPYADGVFDAVYHAHLLEHLPRESALPFLRECSRVLTPGGIVRVVVPDLEEAARRYLESLEKAVPGEADAELDWATLELLDQLTRDRPGGAMLKFVRQHQGRARDLALERLGTDGPAVLQALQTPAPPARPSKGTRLWGWLFGWRQRLLRWLLGREYQLLEQARFRAGGEVHRWMYDRHSLTWLLERAGFEQVGCVEAGQSWIAGWTMYHLDESPDGQPAKPGSLYVEGRKPGAHRHAV